MLNFGMCNVYVGVRGGFGFWIFDVSGFPILDFGIRILCIVFDFRSYVSDRLSVHADPGRWIWSLKRDCCDLSRSTIIEVWPWHWTQNWTWDFYCLCCRRFRSHWHHFGLFMISCMNFVILCNCVPVSCSQVSGQPLWHQLGLPFWFDAGLNPWWNGRNGPMPGRLQLPSFAPAHPLQHWRVAIFFSRQKVEF